MAQPVRTDKRSMNTISSSHSQATKYSAVASALVEQIQRGDFKPGDLLPSEPLLCQQFAVSRHTIRSALRTLNEKGLIVSHRGRGSMVTASSPVPRYSHACDSVEDVLQYASETPREVIDQRRVIVDDALAAQLGCAPGYPWWEIHTVRRREPGGATIASSLIWIPDEFADAAASLAVTDEPLFMLIEKRYAVHFAEIQQAISVVTANATEAEDLNVALESPLMCVERRFVDQRGGLLEVSRSVHPPDSFRYEMNLSRVIGSNKS